MSDYSDRYAAMLRRMVLEALERAPASIAPVGLIQEALTTQGMGVSLDRLRTEVAWLAEQGLLECAADTVGLLPRGADVVAGRADVPGVQRRPPGGLAGLGTSLLAERLRGG